MENYTQSILLPQTVPQQAFDALTQGIALWWSTAFEGSAQYLGHSFSVHFGQQVFKNIGIESITEPNHITWYVSDALLAVPGLQQQREWIGTRIIWDITTQNGDTIIQLTHEGLHPELECFDICYSGWQQFTDSLQQYITSGKGNPYL